MMYTLVKISTTQRRFAPTMSTIVGIAVHHHRNMHKRLAAATEQERLAAELSPGGYGIHWPLIDEDLSVNGLLKTHD
jgi:Protein of unknown function (DUF2442)